MLIFVDMFWNNALNICILAHSYVKCDYLIFLSGSCPTSLVLLSTWTRSRLIRIPMASLMTNCKYLPYWYLSICSSVWFFIFFMHGGFCSDIFCALICQLFSISHTKVKIDWYPKHFCVWNIEILIIVNCCFRYIYSFTIL